MCICRRVHNQLGFLNVLCIESAACLAFSGHYMLHAALWGISSVYLQNAAVLQQVTLSAGKQACPACVQTCVRRCHCSYVHTIPACCKPGLPVNETSQAGLMFW